jgi:hypothetical protein
MNERCRCSHAYPSADDRKQRALGCRCGRPEKLTIGTCVHAVRRSLQACPRLGAAWIVVVADCCDDTTVDEARGVLGAQGEVVQCSAGVVGVARRLGADRILSRFAAGPSARLWIANTDADSAPAKDWIGQQLLHGNGGYCAVAGIVQLGVSEPRTCFVLISEITH